MVNGVPISFKLPVSLQARRGLYISLQFLTGGCFGVFIYISSEGTPAVQFISCETCADCFTFILLTDTQLELTHPPICIAEDVGRMHYGSTPERRSIDSEAA